MTSAARTVHTVRRPTFTTVLLYVLTWPYRTALATASVVLRGSLCTMVAASDGNLTSPISTLLYCQSVAVTEGVTPLFFPKKPGDLFLLIAVTITIAFYCFHSGVTPQLSDLVSPLFFVNLPTKILFPSGVTP